MIYLMIISLFYFVYCWWTKDETEARLYEDLAKEYGFEEVRE